MPETDNTLDIMNLQLTGGEDEEQLIVFTVGDEEFGLDVLSVQEIIRYTKPTKIPHAPRFVEGVIDFRGEVIPVLNIRDRFELEGVTNDEFSVIVVLENAGKVMGMTVDGVSDILNLPKEKIQQAPEMTTQDKTKYLKAMGKFNERLVLILDLEKIFDFNDEKILDKLVSSLNQEDSGERKNGRLNSEIE